MDYAEPPPIFYKYSERREQRQAGNEVLRIDYAEPPLYSTNIVKMWNVLIFTAGIIALSVILLGIKVFFVKGGKFPSSHISDSKPLKKQGITCAVSTDARERHEKQLKDLNDNNTITKEIL